MLQDVRWNLVIFHRLPFVGAKRVHPPLLIPPPGGLIRPEKKAAPMNDAEERRPGIQAVPAKHGLRADILDRGKLIEGELDEAIV